MIASALLSTLHLLALAIGLPGVFLRGRALAKLQADSAALAPVFRADGAWGVAALLWLATGLTRAFGPFEKGPGYYVHNHVFLLKMGLFAAVVLLELYPMVTLIRWRVAVAKQRAIDLSTVPLLRRLNALELGLTLIIPFAASMMARGIGFAG